MYDDLAPPGQDSRWDIFADFHKYLEQRFPLVYVLLETSPDASHGRIYPATSSCCIQLRTCMRWCIIGKVPTRRSSPYCSPPIKV